MDSSRPARPTRTALTVLYQGIEARAAVVVATPPADAWPCRRGCDQCCRRLAELPRLARAEWELLWDAFERLPREVRAQVRVRVEAIARDASATHVTCPLLDADSGACRVYDHRPAACRAYGFYVARGGDGLWCEQIAAMLAARGDAADAIVWGNAAALERELAAVAGEPVTMAEWFAAHPERP